MKRSDDVFFFTLIDFLLQVFFFGLVLFVLAQSTQDKVNEARKEESEQIQKIKDALGVTNLAEITDQLTNLIPIDQLVGFSTLINNSGGLDKVKEAVALVEKAGGVTQLKADLIDLGKFKEGSGKPPCLFNIVDGKRFPKALATVIANDTSIAFKETNAELEEALRLIGRSYDSIRELPMAQFRSVFTPLVIKKPECRYTLQFQERTRLIDARDAARFAFYLNIEKLK
jgi:hypothetical protein